MDLRAGPKVMLILFCQCGAVALIDPLPIDDLKKGLDISRPAILRFQISSKTMQDLKT
jgi:hypothetical protein